MHDKELIEALDWSPIGTDTVPLEIQLQMVKVVRHAALSYPELEVRMSQLLAENRELYAKLDMALDAIVGARRELERVQL